MTHRIAMLLAAFLVMGSLVAWAQPGPVEPKPALPLAAAPASRFALTIYSNADPGLFDPQVYAEQQANGYGGNKLPGYGVIREIRKIDLVEGENTIKFSDVAKGIDPTTVSFKSLTAPDSAAILEQNYEYDLVSPDKLLEKYVGHDILINRKQEPLKDDKAHQPETIEGKLLSYDGTTFVLQTNNKQLPVQLIPRNPDLSEIKLFDLQTGLITKPTLIWKIRADKAGQHDAQVTYQTDQITWRADYNVVVNKDDTAADIGAWVTVVNQSGASYPEAKLKLIAGDVQRLKPPEEGYARRNSGGGGGLFGGGAQPAFTEKGFFEYHLYTLSRPTSLANNSTKQIELFPRKTGVPLTKMYVYYGLPVDERYTVVPNPSSDRAFGTHSNTKVDVYVQTKNTEKNGLGIPLPAGRVRAYKRDDADGLEEFVGEDVIQHTPKDEPVMIRLGSAFDLVGGRVQTDFEDHYDQKWISESFEITLRNQKAEPVKIIVRENLLRWTNWEITKNSDKYEKQDYRTIHIPIEVPPDGEKKITYTVKYSW